MKTAPLAGSTDPAPDFPRLAAPLIERAPLPMVEVEGPQHLVCFVNPPFCRLLHKTRAELIGKPFEKIVRNGDKCVAVLDRVYETGEYETHMDADHSESNPTYWLYAMWPALGVDEQPERVVIQLTKSAHFHLDVAAMNEALLISGLRQHELRTEAEKTNTQSKGEIAERIVTEGALRDVNDQLRLATLAAERANKAKDDFLAALSHELRTPLTPVLIAAAALREDKRLAPEIREQLGMIERNVALEARLIDDLLDLTKISHGKLHLRSEACDAHSLIGLAIEIVREDAREKEIAIERVFTAEHSGLIADPARFQQVVWNLLRNAVKFTPRGGKISIRTTDENTAKAGTWLRIEVADTGIGIDPAGLEQIFLPFDQGGLTGDHRFGGVGLGLAIARAVVQLHGGRITAESPGTNQGATFVVQLPGAVEPIPGVTDTALPFYVSAASSRKKVQPLRLLLVEDHVTTLKALFQLLQHDGHRVVAVSTVAEALTAAAANTFDLVISDLGLPDGTGGELMEKLRATYGLRGIALSGYGMEDDLSRSNASGFVTHLVKPVAIAELRRVLASLGPPKPSGPSETA
jgi:signal transduction histidine kinase/ActR/RegA family two-component response regulator